MAFDLLTMLMPIAGRQHRQRTRLEWMIVVVAVAVMFCVTNCSASCPEPCVCKWKGGKQTVECVNKGLIGLPDGMDPETQVLDVSGSTLQLLHRTLFQRFGLVNLQRVYLSRCRLGHLDDLTFQGLTNLVELDLNDNMLTSVPVPALSELPALMRLSMARNPIRRISSGSFRTLRYLTTLELSQCQIETVEAGAFEGLKALEWLKLDGNSLASLGGATLLPRSLHGVTLHDNPWRCDCHLAQLRAWLVQFNIPLSMEPKCSLPDRLAGRLVKALDPMDYACAPQISVTSPLSTTLHVVYGDTIALGCQVTGDPEPRIAWFHNGHKINNVVYAPIPQTASAASNSSDNSSSSSSTSVEHIIADSDGSFYYAVASVVGSGHQQSELNIVNVTDRENGSYVCSAENRAGAARAEFTLSVVPLSTASSPSGVGGPTSIEYVITVGGVVAAIVLTLVIIVVAVAVRCCCCRRGQRRNRRTRDKTINNIAASINDDNSPKDPNGGGGGGGSRNLSPQLPPRPAQMLLPTSLAVAKQQQQLQQQHGNGYVTTLNTNVNHADGGGGGGGLAMSSSVQQMMSSGDPITDLDQSPDLINDTTVINKWKEATNLNNPQTAVCLVDGSPYVGGGAPLLMYPSSTGDQNQQFFRFGPLSTISEAVQQQQQQFYNNPQAMHAAYPSPHHPYEMAVINPPHAGFIMSGLPLVDAEGFPIDYGLPRPSRPTRPNHSHVRFAEPPSVSVRHYENYILDGDNNFLPAGEEQTAFLADQKYPESSDAVMLGIANGCIDAAHGRHSQQQQQQQQQMEPIRYPSERYPQEYTTPYPAYINGNFDEMMAYSSSQPVSDHHHNHHQFTYPTVEGTDQMMTASKAANSTSASIESDQSTVGTGGGASSSSPFDVSINEGSSSSHLAPGFMSSGAVMMQRQPHESPDEGYEDEGVDGTEI